MERTNRSDVVTVISDTIVTKTKATTYPFVTLTLAQT